MTLAVTFTARAREQVRTIHAWWHEHRTAAPDLFAEELAAAIEILSRFPGVGRRHPSASSSGLRRILLRTTRYHVTTAGENEQILVMTVWHAMGGSGPDL